MELHSPTTLLLSHTDRDGLLSAAALLRALAPTDPPRILLTQGSYLSFELQDLLHEGRTYDQIFVTDTYWHPQHAERLVAGFKSLLAPGGEVAWIDHHPSSVEHQAELRRWLPLSDRSRIIGDREGKFEAVSLVAEAFGASADPVVADLLTAVANGWARRGEPAPEGVTEWMAVVDGLARCPDLAPDAAADIVRGLSGGFASPLPAHLRPLAERTLQGRSRTLALLHTRDWQELPSVAGGRGVFLDLEDEPDANAYELAVGLQRMGDGAIDYFVTQEAPGLVHYVSGPTARAERDARERVQGRPHLRVSTLHKGRRGRGLSWRTRQGIDLTYMTRRRPAGAFLGSWVDAHPYLVKAPWKASGEGSRPSLEVTVKEIGEAMKAMLATYGWSEADRRKRIWQPVVEG